MKTFSNLCLLLLFLIFSNLGCQWTYHPIVKDSSGFLFSVHQIESDSAGIIYCRARAGDEIDIYNPSADSWKRVNIRVPVGMALDKNNNLWIASNGDGLVMYDGTDTVTYNHLLMKYFSAWNSWDMPLAAGISCDDKNNVWFGYGPYLFRLAAGELKAFDLEELGINKMFFEEEVNFYKDKLVFRGNNGYSIIIFDPENPMNYREILLSDTAGVKDKPKVDKIIIRNNEIYCKVTYIWDSNPGKFASIYRFNGDKFDTVAFDYLGGYQAYSIQDFAFDDFGNTVIFASVWDGISWHGELVYYRDWKKSEVYRTPVIDDPYQPVKTSFMFANSIHLKGRDVWICWWSLGVMKFSSTTGGFAEDSRTHGKLRLTLRNQYLILEYIGGDYTAEIYTSCGSRIFSCNNIRELDISRFAKGVYFVKAGNYTEKFIIY